jgi:hypothetical protein
MDQEIFRTGRLQEGRGVSGCPERAPGGRERASSSPFHEVDRQQKRMKQPATPAKARPKGQILEIGFYIRQAPIPIDRQQKRMKQPATPAKARPKGQILEAGFYIRQAPIPWWSTRLK